MLDVTREYFSSWKIKVSFTIGRKGCLLGKNYVINFVLGFHRNVSVLLYSMGKINLFETIYLFFCNKNF